MVLQNWFKNEENINVSRENGGNRGDTNITHSKREKCLGLRNIFEEQQVEQSYM